MLTKSPEKQLDKFSTLFEYGEKIQNWLIVISNILLLIGELMIISVLAYLSQNLTQTAILTIGLPGIIISGFFIYLGSTILKRQESR